MTKEILIFATAGCLALAMLIGGITHCSEKSLSAVSACIEKTGKPLECQAAFERVGK